jgi:predicted MFS family arabinose efflux permease
MNLSVRACGDPTSSSSSVSAFAVLFAGQLLCAAAQCFLLHVPPKVAANWFPEDERARCTSIGALANQLGTAVAFVLGPALAAQPEHVPRLLLVQNCGILVATLLLLAVFRDRPPLPPSLTSALDGFSGSELLSLLRDLPFMLLSVVFGVVIGTSYAVSTLLNETMVPLGYSVGEVGLCGVLMVMGGLLGAALAGYLVDLTHRYKLLLVVFFACAAACLAAYTTALAFVGHSVPLLAAICTALGFFMIGLLPVGMEAAVISTYPVPEAISAGLLLLSCQVFGIAFVVVAKLLEHASSPPTMTAANLLITGAVALAAAASLFWRMQTKRLDAEESAVRAQERRIEAFLVEEIRVDANDHVFTTRDSAPLKEYVVGGGESSTIQTM